MNDARLWDRAVEWCVDRINGPAIRFHDLPDGHGLRQPVDAVEPGREVSPYPRPGSRPLATINIIGRGPAIP